jgi:hypothetical protein
VNLKPEPILLGCASYSECHQPARFSDTRRAADDKDVAAHDVAIPHHEKFWRRHKIFDLRGRKKFDQWDFRRDGFRRGLLVEFF